RGLPVRHARRASPWAGMAVEGQEGLAGVPQLAQNFAVPMSAPQPVQNFLAGTARTVPHSAQNFPAGTWALHLGQVIRPPAAVGAAGCAAGCGGCRCGGVNCGPCGGPCIMLAMPMPTAICAPTPATLAPSPPLAMPSPAPIIAAPAA